MSWRAALAGLLLGLVLGLAIGWRLYRGQPAPVEASAPGVRQADGSQLLRRAPDSAPGAAPHIIPAGGIEERRIHITVKPSWSATGEGEAQVSGASSPAIPGQTCPPVRVDLSLVRMPDQTRRVVASSPDGIVLDGVDIPLEPRPTVPRETRWAVLGGYDPVNRTWAARVDREAGPFRLSLEGFQTKPAGAGVRVWAGVRW